MKTYKYATVIFLPISLILISAMLWATPAFAHRNPEGCTGSGLGIILSTNLSQVHIGDTILFSATIYNGQSVSPVVCEATDITASITSPDGSVHPISLSRTALFNMQQDNYPNEVTYIARTEDLNIDGSLHVTAEVTGVIHQNDTPSQGGGNQSVNITIIPAPVLATLHIIKNVVNTGGGTAVPSDFNLYVKTGFNNVAGSPAAGIEAPGTLYSLPGSKYVVSEDVNILYAQSIGGDCNSFGMVILTAGDNKTCIITNTFIPAVVPVIVPPPPVVPPVVPPQVGGGGGTIYNPIPPIIDVVKVPTPLSLPSGPGAVKYTYTLGNIGTVPVTNITMADDTCSPVVFIAGDTNVDTKLDLNETWTYSCSTTLLATHTNTVVATGWANGISATDIAKATVVVGSAAVPPLIHVTKVPSPLLLPAGGGKVLYTEKVTNPGIVALSNVTIADDKCSPVDYISGDANGDSKLDVNETWTYACQTNLAKTTTNTVTVTGQANGLTARDFAIVTVIVADVPALPNTGFPPQDESTPLNIIIAAGILMLISTPIVAILCHP